VTRPDPKASGSPEVWTEVEGRPRRRWHRETFACAFAGHVVPAAAVARLRPVDAGLGVDLPDGRRLARCLRCDAWVATTPPADPDRETLPALADLNIPRRGRELRDAIVLRLIAIDRGIHSILFAVIAGGLIFLELHFHSLEAGARRLVDRLTGGASQLGPAGSQSFLVRELERFLNLRSHTVWILLVTAVAYAIVEGVEAVGLWLQKRWAEYLTAIATAGFLPFEVHELIKRVTTLRVIALVVNLAILVYLVWKKRLFGIRGGIGAQTRGEELDREALFGPPPPSASGQEPVTLSEPG
jgi:uncharacterized membrane protein (DUF2068 family)